MGIGAGFAIARYFKPINKHLTIGIVLSVVIFFLVGMILKCYPATLARVGYPSEGA